MSENHHDDDKTRTHTALKSGSEIAHYRIIDKIGAGGMGEVYLAVDTKLNRRVALKFLPPHLCQDEQCRARFKREAQAAARLDHPNIAGIYEVGEYQNRPYYAMQFIEGQSLGEAAAQKELPIDRILEIAIQVCEGLQAAHDKGIIHRDIKPSNILVDSHGRVRIVDFGLAAIRGAEELTKTGSTLGTIGYMSPEQVRGEDVDRRSDLFSLGVVLYELITRRNPFKRDSEAATLKAVSDDTPHPLARYRSNIPDGIQAIIDKALEKDVKTRYQTAGGMLADLMRVKRSLDSQTSAVSIIGSTGTSAKSKWFAAALIVAVVAALLLIIKPWTTDAISDKPDKIMLAVLPFENLGAPEHEYFADGITEEITARLAKVHGIGVIARTSTMRYKATDKSIQQIGRDLGVVYLMEGTVRWQAGDEGASRVRVTPQLIRVADESHVWAEIYDEELAEVFTVQADIAIKVVTALDITLMEREQEALRTARTDDLEAYDYYLRGREYWHRWEGNIRGLLDGLATLARAVAIDTTFADAYTDISSIHSFLYWSGYDLSPDRLDSAWQTAMLARKYDSLDSYSHLALGYYYYYGSRDYEQALEHFEHALRDSPSSCDVWAGIGYVKRRMGRWEASLTAQKKAMELDPLSTTIRADLALTARYMRKFDEARYAIARGLELFPRHPQLLMENTMLLLYVDADPKSALTALNPAPGNEPPLSVNAYSNFYCHVFSRQYDSALVYAQQFKHILQIADDTASCYYWMGQVYRLMGETDKSRFWLDSARIYTETMIDRGYLSIGYIPQSLGPIYAVLAQPEKAITVAREETETLSLSVDALLGVNRMEDLALTYAMVGEHDLAINLLDSLLSIPSSLTVPWLRHWPLWDPLRDHPRFRVLIEKYEAEYGT